MAWVDCISAGCVPVLEKAGLKALQGQVVTNSGALANAESLLFFAAQRHEIVDQLSHV